MIAADYVGKMQNGAVAFLPAPSDDQLDKYSRTVLECSPYNDNKLDVSGIPPGGAIPSDGRKNRRWALVMRRPTGHVRYRFSTVAGVSCEHYKISEPGGAGGAADPAEGHGPRYAAQRSRRREPVRPESKRKGPPLREPGFGHNRV